MLARLELDADKADMLRSWGVPQEDIKKYYILRKWPNGPRSRARLVLQYCIEKLTKWLRGIESLIDGRIVILEKVLEFVNKDYG